MEKLRDLKTRVEVDCNWGRFLECKNCPLYEISKFFPLKSPYCQGFSPCAASLVWALWAEEQINEGD